MIDDYPTRKTHPEAFRISVQMLRDGARFLETEEAIATGFGLRGFPPAAVVADAGRYLKDLQKTAFEKSVELFQSGESTLEVEKNLRALGFHPYESGLIAARAREKAAMPVAEPVDTEKKLTEAEALLDRLRKKAIEQYAAVNPEFAEQVEKEKAEIAEHRARVEEKQKATPTSDLSPEQKAFLIVLNRWSNPDGKQ